MKISNTGWGLALRTLPLVLIIGFGLVHHSHQAYVLSSGEKKLLTKPSVTLSKIKDNGESYIYNKETEKSKLKNETVVSGKTDSSSQIPYHTELPKDLSKGYTFGDTRSDISFKLVPLHSTGEGHLEGGRVTYPENRNRKHIYTFKRNGVKEDIILSKASARQLTYKWRLELGQNLEARMLPNGGVGVYSADPNLFGDINIADAKSQVLIDQARKNSKKNTLVFELPAPYIIDAKGRTLRNDVSYKLEGDTLTLTARNLLNKNYPLSIDPTTITTAADFRKGYDDGMISYDTSPDDRITRSTISGGNIGAWTASGMNNFLVARHRQTTVAYNGYVYVIGGCTSGACTAYAQDVQFASIGTGTIGAWHYTHSSTDDNTTPSTSLPIPLAHHGSVVYNGYVYVFGGATTSSVEKDTVYYAPLNSNGTIGTWTQESDNLPYTLQYIAATTANGYVYLTGGESAGVKQNTALYAKLNADGSTGAWATTGTGTYGVGRYYNSSVAYNNFLYVIGGFTGGSSYVDDVYYTPINSDGTLGAWTLTTGFVGAGPVRAGHTSVAYNGYLYVIGGTGASSYATTLYAPINANGTVGTWAASGNNLSASRFYHTSVVYNGYIYVLGGRVSGSESTDVQATQISTGTPTGGTVGASWPTTTNFSSSRANHTSVAYNGYLYIIGGDSGSFRSDVLYAAINTDGTVGTWNSTTSFTTGRTGHTSVAYNGYLYVIGGVHSGTYEATVQYAPINTDGTVGAWNPTTAFTTARSEHTSVAYNGYLYVIGGTNGTNQNDVQYAQIASDGTVGTWNTTTAFTTARSEHTSVAYNGYLYVIGGVHATSDTACNGSASIYCSDVQYAQLNTNGTINGAWNTTTSFGTARKGHTSVAYNGYLYVIGGTNGTRQSDVQYSQIGSSGTVGTWNTTTAFTTARHSHTTVAYNGYLYIIGGDFASFIDDVQYSATRLTAQKATYERIIDIGTTKSYAEVTFNGKAVCGAYLTYRTAGTDGVFGSPTTIAVAPSFTYIPTVSTYRYFWFQYELDDSNCGTNSYIQDFTLESNKPPDVTVLSAPASGAISVGLLPVFQFRASDLDGDYLRYKIELYQSDCTTSVGTFTQPDGTPQTGWSGQDQQSSTAYTGSSDVSSSTMATYTAQTSLAYNTTYCWKAQARDPGGRNLSGSYSPTQTFTTNQTPSVPTLVNPDPAQIGVSGLPQFKLRSTDPDGDYLRYNIKLYSTQSECNADSGSGLIRNIDQTGSQTGWVGQDRDSGNAYYGAPVITNSTMAIHNYEPPGISLGVTYWWKGRAIDPAGAGSVGTWSAWSSCNSFSSAPSEVLIKGGVQIRGGTKIQ